MLSAIWCFLKAIRVSKARYWWGFGIAMGVSLLCKGPVGYFSLFIPFLAAWCTALDGITHLKKKWKQVIGSLLIALIIGVAWPIVVSMTNIAAGIGTLNQEVSSWTSKHIQPWWFYSHFLILTGIWMGFGWTLLNISLIRRRLDGNQKFGTFLLIWIGITLLLLSVMPHKQMRYLLPIWVPVAMTIAGLWINKQTKRLLTIHVIIVFLFSAGATAILIKAFIEQSITRAMVIFAGMLLWATTGIVIQYFKKNNSAGVFYATVAVIIAFVIGVYPTLANQIKGQYDYTVLSILKNDPRLKDIPFYTTRSRIHMQYVFYAGKEIKLWDPKDATSLPVKPPLLILTIDNPLDLSEYKGDQTHIKKQELGSYPSQTGNRQKWIPTLITE
jgi:4-amino-4-deoxy-L-arabinose transferase-like glycosyltransferase